MEKIYIFIGLGMILIILALLYLSFASKETINEQTLVKTIEAEISLQQNGITNIANIYPRYDKINVEYYYHYDYCSQVIERVTENFKDFIEIKKDKKIKKVNQQILEKIGVDNVDLPIIIFDGNADLYDSRNNYINTEDSFKTIIIGVSACSEKILMNSLCTYLDSQIKLCNEYKFPQKYEIVYKPTSDSLCYEFCNIEYISNGRAIRQYKQEEVCSRIKGYIEGESQVIGKQCYGKNSCKNKEDDWSCCMKGQCVNDGLCYDNGTILDVDSNEQKEICVTINKSGFWVNADMNKDVCDKAGYVWLDCRENECKQGIDNYDQKENGLCCGDDKSEQLIKCKGNICDTENSEDKACCNKDSCVYHGECYMQGCRELTLSSDKTIHVYCYMGKWIDLDKEYCPICLGKRAWSGSVCCGDDEGEAIYPRKFVVHNASGTHILSYHNCTIHKDFCVLPESNNNFQEGCYKFDINKYLNGGYYCSKSEWYDLDNNSDYCRECGYYWVGDCCGDDKNEYYIQGEDNTSACCNYLADFVIDGECYPQKICGNNRLEGEEECELPFSENNKLCQQSTQGCFGVKFGVRDMFGDCGFDCKCHEDPFAATCYKGKCGAECNHDIDCDYGEICDHLTCSCRRRTFCGDGIVQESNDDHWNEKCEPPETLHNSDCDDRKKCFYPKTGIRYEYGNCDSNCQCIYTPFEKICVKGSCNGECNQDGTGCDVGYSCDTASCKCIKSDITCLDYMCDPGEEDSCPIDCIIEECPYRIDIQFDKDNYYEDDTMNIRVEIYDKNYKLMPNTDFDIDIVVNNKYIDTISYSTSSLGYFELEKTVAGVLRTGRYEYTTYIAKTKGVYCDIVGDSASAFVYVRKLKPTVKRDSVVPMDLSRYEIVYENTSKIYSDCGNGIIEAGEVCEGMRICRPAVGCDYNKRIFDLPEICNNCNCPPDFKSDPDDEIYCNNCDAHCGDGVVNCGEVCEFGMQESGTFCRDGQLYSKVDVCINCSWYDDGVENDIFIDDCFCECPENPNNCSDGNWIEYTESYYANCSGEACNQCSCKDTYTKDTNNDGIEDKCSPEICDNRIDDNDNGLIDTEDPECSICVNCGLGTYNFCDRDECMGFLQDCYFNAILFGYGKCYNCSIENDCKSYANDKISCMQDSCSFGNCYWNGDYCCIDSDYDDVCDTIDNCPHVYNPNQQNSDNDTRGDVCETCKYEPLLFEPTEENELSCDDNIDNDCDGITDCEDLDCAGIDNCCQTSLDCEQNRCAIENCTNNQCNYTARDLCDNSECPIGYFCDLNGECMQPEISEEVCLNCIENKTKHLAKAFGFYLFDMESNFNVGYCCGNEEDEYYLIQEENKQEACCNSLTDCVDYLGNCVNTNSPIYEEHIWHCSINKWYECSEDMHVLCAEAGISYRQDNEYKTNNQTKWYCTYDGFRWAWRSTFPEEVCDDIIDNDCDQLTDNNDTKCLLVGKNNKDFFNNTTE